VRRLFKTFHSQDADCQRKAWPTHKVTCKANQAALQNYQKVVAKRAEITKGPPTPATHDVAGDLRAFGARYRPAVYDLV